MNSILPLTYLYFWRNYHGKEVDVLIDKAGAQIPVEMKSSKTRSLHFLMEYNIISLYPMLKPKTDLRFMQARQDGN